VINNPETQLGAASPNPFNPVTRISYVLTEQGHARLVVYNVKGQRVATLVDGVMSSGEHVVTWNAKGVSSGVYFYRLTVGDFSETRRMVLLK
ncbi:MAG: T9SS type A sorting domain-containing protein, partial [Candidatus Krumholzibacteriota bacterium]|nr:T9SS type A sorting domain-containing protein [Candidatus Krumholzibacteriota bacterium]